MLDRSQKSWLVYHRAQIVHFKELFALDGKPTNFSENDEARRNTITNLMEEWGLVNIVNSDKSADPVVPLNQLKIISFKEKPEWTLTAKYNIGKKATFEEE